MGTRRLSEVRNWRGRTELSRGGRRVRPKDSGCSGDTWTRYVGTYLRLCAISPLAYLLYLCLTLLRMLAGKYIGTKPRKTAL
ncbi:hypothetical protein CABS01_09674 [Colletotrichum abscissum]|uniref:Uncharacterized protein n=1 Tax=Colletotrichum tamarilloi TaxID=1209934 RepID=A0ABQ9R7N1_9PEZI|nr:uncharacterized protein CTAM01_07968 [Colletotrichum tamarilloi]XP_060400247.1 uncharacterized protein CABS01_09674 [Colletotrichum abscissum]KAI3542117.1 hypothetical protein CSPX01_07109 [Colletotrichum filicis]KAK1497304.1 hypothetical protein CTAM01_07968 [Colletotrichum tamarilloi]KAK1501943.1 hypothetical protein CABS01_09674 [Colletotrichum abscissum]